MNSHELLGCTPEPLMSYLKALGIFRLVTEQSDEIATMCWDGDTCLLETTLDRDGLIDFFQNSYRPSPIVGPWGARSGFYPGSSESSARTALNRIVSAAEQDPRFSSFRNVVEAVRKLLTERGYVDKVRDEDKLALMHACRNQLADDVVSWLDAVYVLTDGYAKFPPLLGTGGNEGSGSYVSTFAQVVVTLLVDRQADVALPNSLFGDFAPSLDDGVLIGHFNPGALESPNGSQGFGGGGGVNPWDYLFAIEGTLLIAGAVSRRLGVDSGGKASFPFCVKAVDVGSASEAGKEAAEKTRAEMWVPLWDRPASVAEVRQLFAEGRAAVGRRQAHNTLDFALATNLLGNARGIKSFVRYAFVERNGLSYFAAPLGRVAVRPRLGARLLDDLALTDWLDRLRRACREPDKTPARYRFALRQVDRAIFASATRSDEGPGGAGLVEVLRAIGRAERTLAGGSRFCETNRIRPLQGLSANWLDRDQADDGSTEFRLAASLAGMNESGKVGPFRIYLEPVALVKGYFSWSPEQRSVVWSNRPIAANLADVFRRRLMESFRDEQEGLPLSSHRNASVADVVAFLRGEVDDEKLDDLIWGLAAVHWSTVLPQPADSADPAAPFEFAVPRLLTRSWAITSDRGRRGGEIPIQGGRPRSGSDRSPKWHLHPASASEANAVFDPHVFDALSVQGSRAVEECLRRATGRLKSGGRLVIGTRNRRLSGRPIAVPTTASSERLLAAFLFPLEDHSLEMLANVVLNPPETTGANAP